MKYKGFPPIWEMPIPYFVCLFLMVASFSVFHYFVISLPDIKRESLKIEAERDKFQVDMQIKSEEKKRSMMDARVSCIKSATDTRNRRWNRDCESRGLDNGCRLPQEVGDVYARDEQNEKDNCIKLTTE